MPATVSLIGPQGAVQRVDLDALLSTDDRERVRIEANRWIKRLRLVRYGSASMRERFTYRGDSLWWFTEIYLHKMRRLETALSVLSALEHAVALHAPTRIVIECRNATTADAARAFGRARRLDVDIVQTAVPPRGLSQGLLVGVSALLSRLRPAPRPLNAPTRVAAFVHTAFWSAGRDGQQGRESYIGPVLDAIASRLPADDLRLIGLGPRRNFRARQWWDPIAGRPGGTRVTPIEQLAPRAALAGSLALWQRRHALADDVVSGDEVRAAGLHGDVDLWPVLSRELRDAAQIQWTWSARAMDEARSALQLSRPDVAVTYAEAGGWGRALVLEARRLSIPTVALQHGFIYRHWLNYQHEADELRAMGDDAGFPYPTRTLVFDRYAAATLEQGGGFPAAAIRVTGSPRLDELAARLRASLRDRAIIRTELGIADDERLLVLAAKATEIGPHLPALVAAVQDLPGVTLVIKPHPAETAASYHQYGASGHAVRVEEPRADLGRLLAASDALVTMNSTVAVDALVLGIPAIVVGLPNNLTPFVDAGVMAGAAGGDMRATLAAVLYDRAAREALIERGAAFADRYEMRADGESAARAADEILSRFPS